MDHPNIYILYISPSAFLSSAAATLVLQSAILGDNWLLPDPSVAPMLDLWCGSIGAAPPTGTLAIKQRNWDGPAVSKGRALLESSVDTPQDRARLLAVASPHAGDWLKALPIASCGLRLDDEAVRVGVGMRLGLPVCEAHRCICGSWVEECGLHGLSCRRGIGRLSRHNNINDILCRAFTSAGIPVVKEPTGLVHGTDLRPDGMTLIPWAQGRCLSWDVTVVDTLAQTNLNHSVHQPGSAAEAAADFKERKYVSLTGSHLFMPVAFETLGPICQTAQELINNLGGRLTGRSGDPREREFLFQRLGIAVQRGNSAALHGTFEQWTSEGL